MSLALPEDGKITAFDKNIERNIKIALKSFFKKAKQDHKIKINSEQPALEIL